MKSLICLFLFVCFSVPIFAQDVPERERERLRLENEHAALEARYKDEKRACYQKFNVNGCLLESRESYLKDKSVLREQDLRYQESERQINAKEAADRLADKNSEANQQQAQQQRDEAVKNAAQRREDNAQKQLDHAAKGTNREAYENKVKQAQDHRRSVEDDVAQRDKPPAAPLPVPTGAK